MKTLLSRAELEAFVAAHVPMVLLHMGGCYQVCVNRAHENEFHLGLNVVETPEDYQHAIANFIREWSEKDQKMISDVECYCHPDKANYIIALRNSDCTFERMFSMLREGQSASGLGFAFNSQNGCRVYDVLNVNSLRRQLGGLNFLECGIRNIGGLKTFVNTESPGVNRVRTVLNGKEIWPSVTAQIEHEGEYHDFDTLLSGALERLDNSDRAIEAARAYVDTEVRKHCWEYSPAMPLAKSIFQTSPRGSDSVRAELSQTEMLERVTKVRERVIGVRNRLYDAPAVMANVSNRVVDRLQDMLGCVEQLSKGARGVDVNMSERDVAFRENLAWFEKSLPQLLQSFRDEFVAVSEQHVIAHNRDETELLRHLHHTFSNSYVFVNHVSDRPMQTIRSSRALSHSR